VATDAVREDLRKVAGTRAARGPGDAVGGVHGRYVVSPTSTTEVAELLRVAGQHGLAVVPRGSGSALGWGVPPTRVDVILDTRGISGVVEHAAGDLVVTVRAGTPVNELQEAVAGAGQQLALDTPYPAATVGGTLAVATSGPRRLLYGTARDLLIGITFVRADGVVAKAGGKVVKNVAGYDFGKLLTGSYGTLGVITEAVFRLHPLPAARRVVTATYPDARTAGAAARSVLGSQVVPTAVELDGPADAVRVTVLVEGVEVGVTARADTVAGFLGPGAELAEDLPDGLVVLPFTADGTGIKVTSSLTGVGPVLAAAHAMAAEHGVDVAVTASAAGVLHAGAGPDADPVALAAVVEGLRAAAAPFGGTATVLTAPPAVRALVDLWGPVPGLDLMRRLKQELDPRGLLSPGRFVGGI
jgi:glycolate dehydrogenase FAD-binding subunit